MPADVIFCNGECLKQHSAILHCYMRFVCPLLCVHLCFHYLDGKQVSNIQKPDYWRSLITKDGVNLKCNQNIAKNLCQSTAVIQDQPCSVYYFELFVH